MSNADILSGVWLFEGVDRDRLEKLATFTFTKEYAPGDLIVEEGHTGNGLYVITSGSVEVVKALNTERATRLATLGPGEFFGEMALLSEWPRSATVRAVDATACLGIDRWLFLEQLGKDAQLSIVMLQALAKRLRELNDRMLR